MLSKLSLYTAYTFKLFIYFYNMHTSQMKILYSWNLKQKY